MKWIDNLLKSLTANDYFDEDIQQQNKTKIKSNLKSSQ